MAGRDPSQLEFTGAELAPAVSFQGCYCAWQQYIEHGVLDIQQIRPEVGISWQRCRNLRLDPHPPLPDRINPIELRERLYKNQNLVKIARPSMENLYQFVRGTGFEVVLTDESGYLLEVLGDEEIVKSTRTIHLCPGGNWNETIKGTNAIGTAIFERRPIQIYGSEHYCVAHHFLTCSAAPIFDPDGRMIGVLDLTGDYHVANAHTLGMVVAAVNAIENQLRLQRATNKLYMAYRYSNILLEHMSDGLISVDNSGIVTEINARGGELFGVVPEAAKGRHISEITDNAGGAVFPGLAGGADHKFEELLIPTTGRRVSASASLLRDELGMAIGAVAVLREVNNRRTPALLPAPKAGRLSFDDIVGESPRIRESKHWAARAAKSPSTVLIHGETGTGKELFAQAIHNASPRADAPFIALNCAAMPESLIESELFGYEDGTFTGAKKGGQPGKFEMANGGTIFLDEVGDMPLAVQVKLLRVIQEKKVARIGAAKERPVDIRIIAATHRDLEEEVRRGAFREDLYYRLHVLEVRIPPLRERIEDLPLLAEHLAGRISRRVGRSDIQIDSEFLRQIQDHTWPGNVRELENAIERAIVQAGDDGLLRLQIGSQPRPIVVETQNAAKPQAIRSLSEVEREAIAEALTFYHGNIQRAAAKLGICRNTLYKKMCEYNLG
jgi:transcriptional regulator of acetoin/glycerol metabolism